MYNIYRFQKIKLSTKKIYNQFHITHDMQSVNCLLNWHGFDSKFCMAGLGVVDDL